MSADGPNRRRTDGRDAMFAAGSHDAKRTALLWKDWLDLQADLRRWTRAERVSAGLIAVAFALLPATLALLA
ncbi:hypothetical protein [Aliidongia dinghuensis]|nr:hypothetical protein [Aliidongia dinghuensis]